MEGCAVTMRNWIRNSIIYRTIDIFYLLPWHTLAKYSSKHPRTRLNYITLYSLQTMHIFYELYKRLNGKRWNYDLFMPQQKHVYNKLRIIIYPNLSFPWRSDFGRGKLKRLNKMREKSFRNYFKKLPLVERKYLELILSDCCLLPRRLFLSSE